MPPASTKEIRDMLESAGILDCSELEVSNRLLYKDKIDILAAVKAHGRRALENVTKGDSILYSRDDMTVSGGDSEFLSSVFLGSEQIKDSDLLRYTGPSKIVIFLSEKAYQERGAIVIDSYSPFNDRASYQCPYKSDVITGHKFCATAQHGVPAHILRMHGRVERRAKSRLPKLIKNMSQGIWTPITRLEGFFSKGGQMASEIGPIPADGGDYLRYLLLLGAIESAHIPIRDRSRLISCIDSIFGIDGHAFGLFPHRYS